MMPLGEPFYRRRVNAIQAQLPDDSHAGIGASVRTYFEWAPIMSNAAQRLSLALVPSRFLAEHSP